MSLCHALSRPTTYTYQLKHVKTTACAHGHIPTWTKVLKLETCLCPGFPTTLWRMIRHFFSGSLFEASRAQISLRGRMVEPRQTPKNVKQELTTQTMPSPTFTILLEHICAYVGSRNFPIRHFKLHNRSLDTFKAQDRWWRGCAQSTAPDFLNRLSWINKNHKQCNMKWMQLYSLPWTGKPTSATSRFMSFLLMYTRRSWNKWRRSHPIESSSQNVCSNLASTPWSGNVDCWIKLKKQCGMVNLFCFWFMHAWKSSCGHVGGHLNQCKFEIRHRYAAMIHAILVQTIAQHDPL